MKRTFRSLLLLAVTSLSFAAAQAQVVTYNFTGTRNTANSPDTYFGDTVTGKLTLDLGASPTQATPGMGGDYRNVPNFKISAVATNFNGGTGTAVDVDDTVYSYFTINKVLSWFGLDFAPDGSFTGRNIQLYITSSQPGLTDPKNDTISGFVLNETFYNSLGDVIADHTTLFNVTLDTIVTNILIGGVDTGIKDFAYQGQQVSAILAGYAASAKNHGAYVESVEKLAEKLVKAKLLTKAQAKTLTQAAEKSDIGKKPKKDKDKDDKGKDKDNDD